MSSIQREIKQGKPFSSAGQEAVVALLRTAALVRRRFEAVCEAEGLTFQQFNVLRILRGAERANEAPLPTMEVAERMIEPEPGITRLLGRLERKGMVRRQQCTEDGRRMLCHITPEGLDALARLDAPVERLDNTVLGQLGDDDLHTLISLLDHARRPH